MKMVLAESPEVVEKLTASLADTGVLAMIRPDTYGTGIAEAGVLVHRSSRDMPKTPRSG